MTTNKIIYDDYVQVDEVLDKYLKKCFVNHLVVYNHCLRLLYEDPELSFRNMKKQAIQYLRDNNITQVLDTALFNELYYQHKKFKFNIRVQKLITDIQYFTFLVKDYQCKNFTVSTDRQKLFFTDSAGVMSVHKELPQLSSDTLVYLNISYSNAEDKYKLNIYLGH